MAVLLDDAGSGLLQSSQLGLGQQAGNSGSQYFAVGTQDFSAHGFGIPLD